MDQLISPFYSYLSRFIIYCIESNDDALKNFFSGFQKKNKLI